MRTLMAIAALTLTLAAVSADAAQTRDVVTVTGDFVRLGDLLHTLRHRLAVLHYQRLLTVVILVRWEG